MLKRIGVNLFPAQAHAQELLREVEDALEATGLSAATLELEITENAALNFEDSNTTLRKVQALGCGSPSTISAPATPRSTT